MEDSLEGGMTASFPTFGFDELIPLTALDGPCSMQFGGVQPHSIASRQITANEWELVVTDYFLPALYLIRVRMGEVWLNLRGVPIRGVDYGTESVRIFPDGEHFPHSDAHTRAYGVSFDDHGNIWACCGSRRIYKLARPAEPYAEGVRWRLVEKVVLDNPYDVNRFVTSFRRLAQGVGFDVIEGPPCPERDQRRRLYDCNGHFVRDRGLPAESWVAGWGDRFARVDGDEMFVTDIRTHALRGLYRGARCVLPDDGTVAPFGTICGTGVVEIGGFVVIAQYGRGYPLELCQRSDNVIVIAADGREGRLVFIPTSLLNK